MDATRPSWHWYDLGIVACNYVKYQKVPCQHYLVSILLASPFCLALSSSKHVAIWLRKMSSRSNCLHMNVASTKRTSVMFATAGCNIHAQQIANAAGRHPPHHPSIHPPFIFNTLPFFPPLNLQTSFRSLRQKSWCPCFAQSCELVPPSLSYAFQTVFFSVVCCVVFNVKAAS